MEQRPRPAHRRRGRARLIPPGPILVGIDGGGTHTRVLACDRGGRFRGYGHAGGCHPGRRPWPECLANLRQAITAALPPGQPVDACVAGLAGTHYLPEGAAEAIAAGLPLRRGPLLVWDNRIALVGALGGAPGIVACAGTGSVVYGLTEDGREVRCTDFEFDTGASAWALTGAVLQRFESIRDDALRGSVLAALRLPDADAARAWRERRLTGVDLGAAAPAITRAAERGVPEASALCDEAAARLAHGCLLLAPLFHSRPVPVAPAGSVALSPYMRRALRDRLAGHADRLRFSAPRHPPLIGAVRVAAELAGGRLEAGAYRALAAAVTNSDP